MATTPTAFPIGRYYDLLKLIPKGDYYAADGDILPFSSKSYQFNLSGTAPSELHVVMLNGVIYKEDVITDAAGFIPLQITLGLGENVIEVINRHDNTKHTIWVTTRHWATWLAGLSDILLDIDRNIDDIHSNQFLNTVNLDKIDEVWGRRLNNTNIASYSLDTYRDVLINIYQAYRRYGGRLLGLMKVVSALTQVNPIIIPVGFGAEWRLGTDFIPNNYFKCTTTANKPDGWGSNIQLTTTVGYFKQQSNAVVVDVNQTANDGGTPALYCIPRRSLLKYRGFRCTFGIWASYVDDMEQYIHIGGKIRCAISFDNGANWVYTGDLVLNQTDGTPSLASHYTTIPTDASKPLFRITFERVNTSIAPIPIRIDRVFLKVGVHTATSLGTNTIVRNKHHQKRGYRCFAWCPDRLLYGEKQLLGLLQEQMGHIFNIVPTHVAMSAVNIANSYALPGELPLPLG